MSNLCDLDCNTNTSTCNLHLRVKLLHVTLRSAKSNLATHKFAFPYGDADILPQPALSECVLNHHAKDVTNLWGFFCFVLFF